MSRIHRYNSMYGYGSMQKAGGAGKLSGVALGPELIPTNDFRSSYWTLEVPWVFSGTDIRVTASSTAGRAICKVALDNNATYRVEYHFSLYAGGDVTLLAGATTGNTEIGPTGATIIEDIVYTTDALLSVAFLTSGVASNIIWLDTVSIRKHL